MRLVQRFLVPVWAILFFYVSLSAAEVKPKSFFDDTDFYYEEKIVEAYQKKHLLSLGDYSSLRRLIAQKTAFDHLEQIRQEWGNPNEAFPQWMEKHPELLETFFTAIDPDHDDFSQALRVLKQLATEYPEKVEQYPELAIAAALIWDQPDTFWINAQRQYEATDPPNPADGKELFLYYTDETMPFNKRIKLFPWELLCLVVAHKTSAEQRRWVLEEYRNHVEMLGKAYNDVEWIGTYPPPLSGKTYTLSNMRTYGGVCTCRADYALMVCRTMGVPSFYGGGGSKYFGGHAWIIWLEIQEITPNKIKFSLEREGQDSFHFAEYMDAQTIQSVTDNFLLARYHRIGSDTKAYRHSELLMRCYPVLVQKGGLTVAQQLKFLIDTNRISPSSEKAWREIAAFGKNGQFKKQNIPNVKGLYHQMLKEFELFPEVLPSLTDDLLAFPEINGQRQKLYVELFDLLESQHRPDLVLKAALNLTNSLLADGEHRKAFEFLADVALKHAKELDDIEPILVQLEKAADQDNGKTKKKDAEFYQGFLTLVLKSDHLPEDYKLAMLRRALSRFEKHQDKKLTEYTMQVIQQREVEKNKK